VNQEIEESAAPSGCPMHAKKAADGVSRRGFLGALGAAGAMAPGVCMMGASSAAHAQTAATTIREDRFGRIFRLPPFATPSSQLTAALTELGKVGGIMDAKDALDQGPILLITDPALNVNNPNNTTQTAGTTFFGQFVDHDCTFDLGSTLGEPTRPEDSTNTRSPALDLDSVYGGGPVRSPQLYGRRTQREPLGGIKLRVEHGGLFEDLPRTADGTAILADPRNDEHVILAGLHAAFLMFHNEAVDYVAARNRRWSTDEIFREAQRLVRWHYQWILVHEFLPQVIGSHWSTIFLETAGASIDPRSASCRSSSRARSIAWATAWCVRPIARTCSATTVGRSLPSSSILRPKGTPTRATCAAACGHRGGSSAGRRSSTSATAR
jgi:hypothetical protein